MRKRLVVALVGAVGVATLGVSAQRGARVTCDPDNGGLKLPSGFCALVVADNLGPARHLAVAPNGDIHVMVNRSRAGTPGGIVALRDTDGDGRADERQQMATLDGTEIRWRGDYLYLSSDSQVGRYKMTAGQLLPTSDLEIIATGFPEQRQHASKSFAFDDAGNMYVNIGAPSNACQSPDRRPGVPGQDPCPLLERHGGIWRFSADKPNQDQVKDGYRFATGLRNVVAIAQNPADGRIYVVQHGRDALDTLWPDKFTSVDNAERPAEEMFRLSDGTDYGWPKCFYDLKNDRKVLNPEYGGDGSAVNGCDKVGQPIAVFPAHIGPNDLVFYTGDQFPAKYQGGAFVAFHGSWNRAPEPQAGYNVMFVPFKGNTPSGKPEVFAEGFAATKDPRNAEHRPTGLAQGPDGSLYVSDSQRGTIWRIMKIAD
ncbi:MAG: sorbosone dehydrogenase family protein [Vicinamibacterales bacterium]